MGSWTVRRSMVGSLTSHTACVNPATAIGVRERGGQRLLGAVGWRGEDCISAVDKARGVSAPFR